MSGVKGRSGTNKGKDKPWTEALRLVVFRDDETGKRRLLKIAEQCAAAAETGDMAAIREIGDRLDGKPAQESTVTIDDKRDATDWNRGELVALLSDAKNGGSGTTEETRLLGKPDRVH